VPGFPLITGATGFAGGHLLERLVAQRAQRAQGAHGSRVHAWAHRGGQTPGPDASAVTWASIDLLDRAAVRGALDLARPTVIYHCAGIADVSASWHAPALVLKVNVLGTHILLEALRELGLRSRVVLVGSALVYRPGDEAIDEDHPIGPTHTYGISKLAQELTAAASSLPTLLARPFNHAGPRQSPSYATSAFAQQIADIEAGRRAPVLHVGNLDARRDITDVRDTVRAYQALAESGQPGRPYNVCSGRAYSMRELLDILLSQARARVRVEVDPARLRPSDNPVILGSHARLTADTGWTPIIPIEQTLADLLDYWRRTPAPGANPSL
jgi:GDP-4-dehydro-6-deoxy-D-mannose reductase